jgi:hypothetical protein
MSWKTEHGEEYAVPDEISGLPFLHDESWHNDAAPCFATEDGGLRLYIDHPDLEEREVSCARFSLQAPEAEEYRTLWEGDDVDAAVAAVELAYAERYTTTSAGRMDKWLADAKARIIADFRAGRFPAATATFSKLHDYVDANEYVLEAYEADPDVKGLDNANRLAFLLDEWLRSGALADEAPTTFVVPGTVYAIWDHGEITKLIFDPGMDCVAQYDDGPDPDIDTADVDGPFWKAVQAYLSNKNEIVWEE